MIILKMQIGVNNYDLVHFESRNYQSEVYDMGTEIRQLLSMSRQLCIPMTYMNAYDIELLLFAPA